MSSNLRKYLLYISSSVAIGYTVVLSYRYWRRRQLKSMDEGFEEDTKRIEDIEVKRVLVLGKSGSGKSTVLTQLTQSSKVTTPMEGFHVANLQLDDISLSLWEIAAGKSVDYWEHFLQDLDCLIYVVDSPMISNISRDKQQIHYLLTRLKNIPALILAHKQDLSTALNPEQLMTTLELCHIPNVCCLGTQWNHPSINVARQHLLKLCGYDSVRRND